MATRNRFLRVWLGISTDTAPNSDASPLLKWLVMLPDEEPGTALTRLSANPGTVLLNANPGVVVDGPFPTSTPPGGTAAATAPGTAYSYDFNSHGFTIFLNTPDAWQVRIDRIDGAVRSGSGWSTGVFYGLTTSGVALGYTKAVSFNPSSGGLGGIEGVAHTLTLKNAQGGTVAIPFTPQHTPGSSLVVLATGSGYTTGGGGGSTTTSNEEGEVVDTGYVDSSPAA